MNLRKEIINELSKPIPANLHIGIQKLSTKKAMKKYEEQLDNHIIDCCFKILEKRIDELRKKYPKDLYGAYNAGLDDVNEMLK